MKIGGLNSITEANGGYRVRGQRRQHSAPLSAPLVTDSKVDSATYFIYIIYAHGAMKLVLLALALLAYAFFI